MGRYDFAKEPYIYYYYKSKPKEEIVINELSSFSFYLFRSGKDAYVSIENVPHALSPGDAVRVENGSLNVHVAGGSVEFLVAGTKEAHQKDSSIRVIKRENIKKVTKPWGYELWISGEHPGYALKHIHIKSGFRTSLQYHRWKRETNVIFAGLAKCSYKNNQSILNDDLQEKDLAYFEMTPISILNLDPEVVHRIESVEDITLCEASTPHLDDVVRVLDDKKRGDGRIPEEHSPQ